MPNEMTSINMEDAFHLLQECTEERDELDRACEARSRIDKQMSKLEEKHESNNKKRRVNKCFEYYRITVEAICASAKYQRSNKHSRPFALTNPDFLTNYFDKIYTRMCMNETNRSVP